MCYTEITPRLLVGGWVGQQLYMNMLARADVTHIVNMRHERVGEIVGKQFKVLECEDGELDDYLPASFWCKVFDFTARAFRGKDNKIYFHVPARQHAESPVGCYAGLRSVGYSAIQARLKLETAHPILCWHESAMKGVDSAFTYWCKQSGKNPEIVRQALASRMKEAVDKHVKTQPFGFSSRVAESTVV